MTRNPDGPPDAASGLFGLDDAPASARVVALPVPFEATVSYRTGTRLGPEAIRRASHQVDLLDADVGDLRAQGIATLPARPEIAAWNEEARVRAVRAIEAQARGDEPDPAWLAAVDDASSRVESLVHDEVARLLAADKIPFVVGGDHSVPLGAITAAAARTADLGVLHFDAHADLRLAYEGFAQSHASIMRNVRARAPSVRLTQVGIRDFSPEELDVIRGDASIVTYFDRQLRDARLDGGFRALAGAIVDTLPPRVWISFDIDGLDPALCPHTGTPVPGGLSFDEAIAVLEAVVASGRVIVGGDLVEVSPGEDTSDDDDSWDATVGARLLYKMMGYALMSTGEQRPADLPTPPRG